MNQLNFSSFSAHNPHLLNCFVLVYAESDHESIHEEALEKFTSKLCLKFLFCFLQKFISKLAVTKDDAAEAFQHVVKMRLSKIVAHGCPGSGKTSLLDLIMGKPPATARQSTGCVEPHARAITTTAISAKDWEEFGNSSMLQKFRRTIRKVIEEAKERNHADRKKSINAESMTVTLEEKEIKRKSIDTESMTVTFQKEEMSDISIMADDESSLIASSELETSAQSGIELENLDQTSENVGLLLDELTNVEGSDELMDAHLVLTVDSGGQHQFQDISPLFLGSNSLFLITVKLNERLNAKSKFSYYIDGESIEISRDDLHLTYLEMIKLLAQYVLSIKPLYSSFEHPRILIVGTFEDKAGDCDETIGEKNDILKNHLKGYTEYCVLNGNEIIFPVNSMELDPVKRKVATEKFQRMISQSLGLTDAYNVPVNFFGLLLIMIHHANQKKHGGDPALVHDDKYQVANGVPVLTLNECIQIGKSMNMNEKEVKDALELFHKLNLLLYFPNATKLCMFVFINIMPILKELSSLIGISFIDNEKLKNLFRQDIPLTAQNDLRRQGCFQKELLEKFFNFCDPLTVDLFLDLLEHLKIVAPIQMDESDKIFLPCALLHASEDVIDTRIQQQSSPHSTAWILRLQYKKGICKDEGIPIPSGYFPALVVHFLNSKDIVVNLPGKKVVNGKYHQQYRNAMTFLFGGGGFIHLIERPNYLEVHFSLATEMPQECFNIRNAICKAADSAEKSLCFSSAVIEKEDAFFCFCNGHELHFCAVTNHLQSQRLICDKTRNSLQLSKLQYHWLLPASKLSY